jgi:hypothetical protein
MKQNSILLKMERKNKKVAEEIFIKSVSNHRTPEYISIYEDIADNFLL